MQNNADGPYKIHVYPVTAAALRVKRIKIDVIITWPGGKDEGRRKGEEG